MKEALIDGTDLTNIELTKDNEKKTKLKHDRAAKHFLDSETEDGCVVNITHVDRLDGTCLYTTIYTTIHNYSQLFTTIHNYSQKKLFLFGYIFF